MKHRIFLMLFLPAILLLTGCEDDSDVLLNCTIKQMTYDHEGGSQTLIIESDADWSIYGLPDWISTSVYSGIRTQEVTLTTTQNWTGLDRQQDITIRTNDGKKTIAIRVIQYASTEGRTLQVDNTQEKFFNGQSTLEGYEDSIVVQSSIQWTITGPTWLSCSFNNKVSPMNGEMKTGSGTLYLRACQPNYYMEAQRDTIYIQSELGDIIHKVPVVQVGAMDIRPVNMLTLTDAFICHFRYGFGVGFFSYDLYNNEHFEALQNTGLLTPRILHSECPSAKASRNQGILFSNLKTDTDYNLVLVPSPLDDQTLYYDTLYYHRIHTPSEVGQPRASISNVRLQDNSWYFDVTMNQFCKGYYFAVLSGNYIGKSKAYIALRLYNLIEAGKFKPYETNQYAIEHTNNDIILASWAIGKDGKLSDVLEIYRASNSEEP